MSEPDAKYIPKVLVFVYHNGDFGNYLFSLTNISNNDCSSDYKEIEIHKKLMCFLINYGNAEHRVHHISIKKKDDTSLDLQYNINSTIMEIKLLGYSQDDQDLFNDVTKYDKHENVKILFKYATSKLDRHIEKAEKPFLHYLFNIQPNGKILSANELLEFAKDFMIWLPSLIEKMKDTKEEIFFYSEYIYFIFKKFWQGQIFGATALISAMYHQENDEFLQNAISEKVKKKIDNNTFSLPIDLEFSDLEFAEGNLNLISQNIIACNEAYLAFLAGYQVRLHSKFIEYTKEWLVDLNPQESKFDINQFAAIFCNRIKATFMGRQFLAFSSENKSKIQYTSSPDAVIKKFVEFSKIFLEKNKSDVKEALRKHKDEYITEDFISSLDF